ncbi:UGSC family (seleno)protein [Sporomusa termitida]|uniref:UGSC-like domain-containing protein n=1 Tax=Sporomusa termitida TaxID=2377 RepID=A0A517E1J9_9FIRM|nr:hypothetical protein [Sporomusa termitida]QDR83477.1 hypothetical protein SPTER_49680 [Sporomusa termitida]
MNKRLDPIMDPRGRQERPVIKLAPRKGLNGLINGKILFYDNTKLDFCYYNEVFVRIKSNFNKMGATNFVDYKETVRGKDTPALEAYAAMLADEKPAAAIVALGDMGTSSATTIVAIEMEKLGIPTVYVTASPGGELVEGVAFYRAGNLCLCKLDIYQASLPKDIHVQIDTKWDYIIDSLTKNGEELRRAAHIDFKIDKTKPRDDGLLPLTDNIEIDESQLYTPGAYMEEVMDFFHKEHLGDGLPIIPPTRKRYEKMLEYCPFDPDTVLAVEVGPSGKDITVKDLAIAAVMAGCKPEYMPIIITAFKCMADPKYNLLQSVTTSYPGGNLILVSGPLAKELGISGRQGCLGPGFPANNTIGRAINLVIMDVCRAVPGVCDLDCQASPVEFSYCFAEDEDLAPWKTINEEFYDKDTTAVWVLKAEPARDIIDFLSLNGGDLIDTLTHCCTTIGSNNAYMPSSLLLVLTPDHGKMLVDFGYNKQKIKEHIHLRAVNETPMVRGRGLVPVRPEGWESKHPMPVTRSPEDVFIVVAGGRGGHSQVILPWGLHSEAIIKRVELPDGKAAQHISEFGKYSVN